MATKMTKKQQILSDAIEATLKVDRSNEGMHTALKALVLQAKANTWKDIELVQQYLLARHDWADGPKKWGLVTNSAVAWFKQVVKLDIDTKTAEASTIEGEEYSRKWNREMRSTPWYLIARKLQEFKVPDVDKGLDAMARTVARTTELGQEVDYEGMIKVLQDKVAKVKATKAHKNWVADAASEAKKKGLDSIAGLVADTNKAQAATAVH